MATIATAPRTALLFPKPVTALPVNGVTVADGDPVVGEVPFDVEFVEARVKLAQVRRVALLLCRTIDLSPK